jgi:hypothetical protein
MESLQASDEEEPDTQRQDKPRTPRRAETMRADMMPVTPIKRYNPRPSPGHVFGSEDKENESILPNLK